jgi:hypothetical protein
VLDAGGRVKAFQKQDGASLMRFEIAYGKAFAALALNRSSRQVLQKAKEKPAFIHSLGELADGPIRHPGGETCRAMKRDIAAARLGHWATCLSFPRGRRPADPRTHRNNDVTVRIELLPELVMPRTRR